MKHRSRQRFIHNSTIFRVYLYAVFFLGIAVICTAFLLSYRYSQKLYQTEQYTAEEAVDTFYTALQEKLDIADRYSAPTQLMKEKVEDVIRTANFDAKTALAFEAAGVVSKYLVSCSNLDGDIRDLFAVSLSDVVYHYSSSRTTEDGVLVSYPYLEIPQLQSLLAGTEKNAVFYSASRDYAVQKDSPVITLAWKIYDTEKIPREDVIGLFLTVYPYEVIDSFCLQSFCQKGGTILAYDRNGVIFYSSNGSADLGKNVSEQYSVNEEDSIVFLRKTNTFDVSVQGFISKKSLFREITIMQRSQFAIVAFLVLISVIGIWISFISYYRRIYRIVDAMQEANLSKRIDDPSRDELSLISSAYNSMCDQMQEWINRHYRAKVQMRTAELNALTAQINPHFIYNTIESIRMQAVMDGNEDVSEMLMLFGMLFRWTMKPKQQIVRLEEELEYIQSYLQLQQIRFPDELSFSISVEDDLLDYGIPKLILQPIVENAIIHGKPNSTQACRVLTIRVELTRTEDMLIFTVADDGMGMTEQTLQRLRESLSGQESDDDDIGVKNVHNRIRLLFGESCGLQIESTENVGTRVQGIIPLMTLEEMNQNV